MRWITTILVAAFIACLLPGGLVAPARVVAADPPTAVDPAPAGPPVSQPTVASEPPSPAPSDSALTHAAPGSGSADGDSQVGAVPASAPVSTTTDFVLTSYLVVIGYTNPFRVQINPAPLGGTVELKIDGTLVASATVPSDGNDTWLYWSGSTPGPHIAKAYFLGTAGFAASASPDFPIEAWYPAPAVQVTASTVTPDLDAPVDFTATLSPDPGTGTIEWLVDDQIQATVPLEAGGVSHWTHAFAVKGDHAVRARFPENGTYLSNSGSIHVQVPEIPTTVTITVPDSPIPAGPITATVTISPVPPSGTIQVWTTLNGTVYPAIEPDGSMDVPIGTFGAGDYIVSAFYEGDARYGSSNSSASFSVLNSSSISIATNRTSAVQGELPVTLTATLAPTGSGTNTVTFLDDVGGVVQEFGPYTVDTSTWTVTYTSSALRVGVHAITARFDGVPGLLLPATSNPLAVTVVADTTVHTTFTRSLSTFYAYKDGYKDSVTLSGVLDEKATVTVRIYSSGGSLKRTYSLGWKGPGAFSASWNGRTATGTAVSAGTYTVKGSFKDVTGHARTITTYVTVSWRQVTWKTGATILRYGDQLSYYGTPGSVLYLSADSSRGRVLYSAEFNRYCDPCQTIYGITTFTLNTSSLAARYVKVTITGHTFAGDYHAGQAYVVKPGTSTKVLVGYPPDYLAYPTTSSISPSYVSSDHKVRFLIWCTESSGDVFDLHYMKMNYQYAVWK